MEKTVAEMFAGVGGFRVGLNQIKNFDSFTGKAIENGEWEIVWANQWEPSTKIQHAYDCYVTRFGKGEIDNTDISQYEKSKIPNHTLLVGGFPCQDYSVARSLSGNKGIEGKKGVLFWEVRRVLEEKRPPFFLLENVDRLLKSPADQRGRDFGIMLRSLNSLDYDVEWRVINAADYGHPQRRRRVFIFGWKNDLKYSHQYDEENLEFFLKNNSLFAKSFRIEGKISNLNTKNLKEFKDEVHMTKSFIFDFQNTGISVNNQVLTFKSEPILSKNKKVIKDILDKSTNTSPYILDDNQIKKMNDAKRAKAVLRKHHSGVEYFYTEGQMSEVDSIELPARTMLTSEKSINRSTHVIIDPILNRRRFLTPVEAERLQEFPDNWTNTGMPHNRRYFMMGNALVTGIVSKLSEHILLIIENENKQ